MMYIETLNMLIYKVEQSMLEKKFQKHSTHSRRWCKKCPSGDIKQLIVNIIVWKMITLH